VLISVGDGDELLASTTGRFALSETVPGTYYIGGCVSPGAGLVIMEKRKISYPYRLSNPYSLVVQPVRK
jgi:hypothetical protein